MALPFFSDNIHIHNVVNASLLPAVIQSNILVQPVQHVYQNNRTPAKDLALSLSYNYKL